MRADRWWGGVDLLGANRQKMSLHQYEDIWWGGVDFLGANRQKMSLHHHEGRQMVGRGGPPWSQHTEDEFTLV